MIGRDKKIKAELCSYVSMMPYAINQLLAKVQRVTRQCSSPGETNYDDRAHGRHIIYTKSCINLV